MAREDPAAAVGEFPNAMPSVHVSTVWFNARPWPLARVLMLIFVVLTIMSMLGLGEHYIVDVTVAFPYALGIQGLCTRHATAKNALLKRAHSLPPVG